MKKTPCADNMNIFTSFSKCSDRTIITLAVIFLLIGGLTLGAWFMFFPVILRKQLVLEPGSMSHEIWSDIPIPMYLDFYLFNVTNPEEVVQCDAKPHLVELGPYSYLERRMKANVSWINDGAEVEFRNLKTWEFDPERSSGSEDDRIIVLNAVVTTAISAVIEFSPPGKPDGFLIYALNEAFSSLGSQMFVETNIREIFWTGYRDPLFDFIESNPIIGLIVGAILQIPFDRFGWFYWRNGNTSYDGTFVMNTGKDDISSLGVTRRWNGASNTSAFDGQCGVVRGSCGGELFPPGQSGDPLEIFVSDLCRSTPFVFEKELTSAEDIPGYRYILNSTSLLNNGSSEATACNCNVTCVFPSGVLDVSRCKFGAPAYVSLPHFYQADPSILEYVTGLNPQPSFEKYGSYLELEPRTGAPLDVRARFQINLHLKKLPGLFLTANMSEVMFPQIWFEQSATMTEEFGSDIKLFLVARKAVLSIGGSFLAIGVLIVVIAIVWSVLFQLICKERKF